MAKKSVLDSLIQIDVDEEPSKHIETAIKEHEIKEKAVKLVAKGGLDKKAGRKPARGEKATKQVPLYLTETDFEKLKTIGIQKGQRPGEVLKSVFLKWLDRQK